MVVGLINGRGSVEGSWSMFQSHVNVSVPLSLFLSKILKKYPKNIIWHYQLIDIHSITFYEDTVLGTHQILFLNWNDSRLTTQLWSWIFCLFPWILFFHFLGGKLEGNHLCAVSFFEIETECTICHKNVYFLLLK